MISPSDHEWIGEQIDDTPRSALPSSFIPDGSDEIIQQLGEELDPFSKLAARFEKVGSTGNMWEHFRKIKLAEAKERVRASFGAKNEKITDGRVDDLGHLDPIYRDFVKKGVKQKEEYHERFNRRIDHYISLRELSNKGMR